MITLAAVTFDQIFPSFEDQIQILHNLLIPVAAVLMIAGLLSSLRYATTPRSILRAMMVTILITTTIALAPEWLNLFQTSTQSLVNEMQASPENAADRYVDLIIQKQSDSENSVSLLKFRLSIISDLIVIGILKIIGVIASFIIWIAYILQKFLLGFAYALAPIFLAMFALRSTSSIATRYIMSIVGLLLWPLGWAAASIGTSNLIDVFTNQGLAGFGPAYNSQSTLGAGVIGLWIIASTFIAPVIIQTVIASGANFGSALIGGALTGTTDAGKAAAGAAIGLSTGGAGLALAGAGAAASASSSVIGSTMRGGGGGFSGRTLQSLAPRLSSSSNAGSSSSEGSSSGGSATNLPALPAGGDISGDQQAASAMTQSDSSSESPPAPALAGNSSSTSLPPLPSIAPNINTISPSDLSGDQKSAALLNQSKNKLS